MFAVLLDAVCEPVFAPHSMPDPFAVGVAVRDAARTLSWRIVANPMPASVDAPIKGELRNTLAHDVSQVSFTFDGYITGMDPNQKKQLAKVFGHGCHDPITVEGKKVPLAKFAVENTKLVTWLTAGEVLACLYLEYEIAEIRLKAAALNEYRRSIV